MAKARAICTCERCGATFYVEATRASRKSADEWEAWAADHYTVCRECEAKEYQELAEKAAKQAQEDGLPALRGTERQVAWAEQIRQNKLVALNAFADELAAKGKTKTAQNVSMTTEYILHTKASARWWIDNRDATARALVDGNYEAAKEAKVVQAANNAMQEVAPELREDTILHPENEQYGTANVVVAEKRVEAYYPKDDTFRGVVKAAGYQWDPTVQCWAKGISQFTGSVTDRAAELANKLLTTGFAVQCQDAKARELAVSGTFKPENKRWVKLFTSGSHEGWLAVWVPRRGEDDQGLYEAARKIKSSRYDSGFVAVPVARWALVEDFAQIYGYEFSAGAQKAIADFQEANTITPELPPEPEQRDPLADILNSSADILPDLLDD